MWLLSKPTVKKAIIDFFVYFLLNKDRELLYKYIDILMAAGANKVFVEKVNGKPYRKYMSNVCRLDNKCRSATLFVAFFGY